MGRWFGSSVTLRNNKVPELLPEVAEDAEDVAEGVAEEAAGVAEEAAEIITVKWRL